MQKDMTRGPILPLILQFLFPMFIGNVFQQLYNMADMIIVGRYVGAGALAAVGSTGTLMFLVWASPWESLPGSASSPPSSSGPKMRPGSGEAWPTAPFWLCSCPLP